MFDSVTAIFDVTEEQLNSLIEMFVGKLPDFLQRALERSAHAA